MKFIPTDIEGVVIIEPDVYADARGFFLESFHREKYAPALGDLDLVQDNLSSSLQGTVRGLHFQNGALAQGKLCQVLSGAVLDVAVDLRRGSPTYGRHVAVELSAGNKRQVWIPTGFAHGFSVLSDTALFHYKCTRYYHKASERCLLYNDPALGIDWLVTNPIVSDKDRQGSLLADLQHDFVL